MNGLAYMRMQAKSTHFIINDANITSEIIQLKTMEKYKIIQSSFGTLCDLNRNF